jgi:hypothetical protein
MSVPRSQCALSLSREMLSSWRDRLLPEADAQRIALHVTDCAACQYQLTQFAQIAAAVQRQRVPDLRAQTWRGIQMQLETTKRAGFPRNLNLRGVGAALAAVLVATLIFVVVAHNKGGTRPSTIVPTKTAAATTATAQPSPTPTTISTFLTPAQAWGNFPNQSIDLTQNTTIYPDDIFPDASAYVGSRLVSQSEEIDVVSLPNKSVRPVYTAPAGDGVLARTDGRYVAWVGGGGVTGGQANPPPTIAGYVDLQSGQVTKILNGSRGQGFGAVPTELAVDHGIFVWLRTNNASEDLVATDMANGKNTTIATQSSGPDYSIAQVSWPFVLYQIAGNEHLFNLQNNTDITSAQIANEAALTFTGTTAFGLRPGSHDIALDEIDHIDQPNAPARTIAILPLANQVGKVGGIGANSRLVVFDTGLGLFAWDRVLDKLVQLNPAQYYAGYVIGMRGNGLFYPTGSNVVNGNTLASKYTFVNTNQLPTSGK